MTSLLLLHGPNLNLLGTREPTVYGSATLADYEKVVADLCASRGCEFEALQSNHEGVLIDKIQEARGRHSAILINAGAFTHYSWAIHDALRSFDGAIAEVHISNPHAREHFRRLSVIAPVATISVAGMGIAGYRIATEALLADSRVR